MEFEEADEGGESKLITSLLHFIILFSLFSSPFLSTKENDSACASFYNTNLKYKMKFPVVSLLTLLPLVANACSCFRKTQCEMQEQAQNLIRGIVTAQVTVGQNVEFTFDVREVYKASGIVEGGPIVTDTTITITSSLDGGLCGLIIPTNVEWLIDMSDSRYVGACSASGTFADLTGEDVACLPALTPACLVSCPTVMSSCVDGQDPSCAHGCDIVTPECGCPEVVCKAAKAPKTPKTDDCDDTTAYDVTPAYDDTTAGVAAGQTSSAVVNFAITGNAVVVAMTLILA